jgi:hypothetical protein
LRIEETKKAIKAYILEKKIPLEAPFMREPQRYSGTSLLAGSVYEAPF